MSGDDDVGVLRIFI